MDTKVLLICQFVTAADRGICDHDLRKDIKVIVQPWLKSQIKSPTC